MILGADEKSIRDLVAWARAGATPEEIKARMDGVHRMLLDGANADDTARIRTMFEAIAQEGAKSEVDDDDVEEDEEEESSQKKRKRGGIYSPNRRGYMRATTEEGIADELRKMNEEASGTPFFDSLSLPTTRPRSSNDPFEAMRKRVSSAWKGVSTKSVVSPRGKKEDP